MDTRRGLLVSRRSAVDPQCLLISKELALGSGAQRAMDIKTNTFCAVSSAIVIDALR